MFSKNPKKKLAKKCSSCGYIYQSDETSCPVCGNSNSKSCNIESNKGGPFALKILLFVAIVLAFYLVYYNPLKKKQINSTKKNMLLYDYKNGMDKTLDALANVIIPDPEEENVVIDCISSCDSRFKLSAVRTLLYWAAYSMDKRQFYLKKAASVLNDPIFEMKKEAIGMFISMLSLKTFNPGEMSVFSKELSLLACSDRELREKAFELIVMLPYDKSICQCLDHMSEFSKFSKYEKSYKMYCGQ